VSPSRGLRADVAARREKVIQFRSGGMKFADIARELGHASPSAAVVDYQRAMKARQAEQAAVADVAVTQELERLDRYVASATTVLGRAQRAGDDWMVLRAVDRLSRLSAQRSVLLGLYAAAEAGGNRGERPEDVVDDLAERRRRRRAAAHR